MREPKPRTAADVQALPELRQYDQVDCPHCHHTINLRKPDTLQLGPFEPDDIIGVRLPDGDVWQPIYVTGGWFRKRVYIG